MNLEDKHMDDLFRDAASQSSAPEYHSSYWKEMEGLLNDSKNRRKQLLFWSSILGIVMIGLVSALLLSIFSETKYNKVDLAFEAELVNLSNRDPLNLSTSTEFEILDNAGLISNAVIASKETIITKKGESHENNTSSVIEAIKNQNKLLIENNKPIKVEGLPLIPINLGFNLERLNSESNELYFQPKSFSSQNPFTASFEIGAGLSQVYENSRSHPKLFNAAVKLDYKLNNFLFSTGLGIMVEQNTGITVSERAKVYGFGITNFEHSLNYKTLVDITIPVQTAYKTGKNSFGLGMQLRYLANSFMRFESKQNGETMMADNLIGLSTGLNKLNVDAFGFYERSLSNKFSIGLRITQQLTSRIASDKYFNNLDRTKTLNGQFYIKYSIFNH